MSSHDARYEDSPAYDDEPGTTTTRTDEHSAESINRDDTTDKDVSGRDDTVGSDTSVGEGPFGRLDEVERAETFQGHDSVDRHDVTDGGPVLLPVDPPAEPTTDEDGPTRSDTAPVTIVDAGPSENVSSRGADPSTVTADGAATPAGFGTVSGTGTTDSPQAPDSTEVGVGPDTETGALKDPVPDGTFDDGTTAVPVADPATSASPTTPVTSSDTDWRELQGRFVDDPQAAVREAGALVEKAVADLRTRSESGSTEDLRTAFRRYRDLHAGLS
jgi:hypothetical protein